MEKYKDFYWLNEDSRTFLKRGYLLENVGPEQRVLQIAETAESILEIEGFAEKFFGYMAKGFYSLSSPIWANFGLKRGLPISCFGSYIEDSISGIMSTVSEVGMMSKIGGGTSAYFGDIRPRGSEIKDNGTTDGSFNFTRLFDTTIDVISQGTSRKGQFAGYIDVEHGDIEEWLEIHGEGNPIQLMYYGVCIGKSWWKEMKEGDQKKRDLWAKILQRRCETGIPYIFFKDNANEGRPEIYKEEGYTIKASNLCTEIMLPSDERQSFVCCLSSMNLLHFEEWKNTDAVETLVYFLDAVLSEFILKGIDIPELSKAVSFAYQHRAIGIGVLGWHSYLQNSMIPFDSLEAYAKNNSIFQLLKEKTYKASEELALILGKAPLMESTNRRHATLLSVAPTKSSSFILGGVSQSIEPFRSNYYIKDLAKIKVTYKNPYLERLLKELDKDTEEVWQDILIHQGSVQHLDFLTPHEKEVFRTFIEISQLAVIQQAAQRQKHIDQGQSVNIMINSKTPVKDLNSLYIRAEELGLKSLYYQINVNAAQEFNKELLTCSTCEG